MTTTIAIVEGDGVGKEVIPPAEEVLRFFLPDAEYIPVELGYERWQRTGEHCTDADIALLKTTDAILFGAVTTIPDPNYPSIVLRIRKELDLYANLRPIIGPDFDILIVRENTEGLYSGIEWQERDRACTLRVVSERGTRRIAEMAIGLTKERRHLTIGDKSNIMASDAYFRGICTSMAEEANVPYRTMFIDALTYDILMHPQAYDVVLTTNIFGDILSDACGYLAGGLGLLPSANVGEDHAFFEPVHGSAPDIAGRGIANPVAAIRSAALLLEHLGMKGEGEQVFSAVETTIREGTTTPDLGGTCTTAAMGQAILDKLLTEL